MALTTGVKNGMLEIIGEDYFERLALLADPTDQVSVGNNISTASSYIAGYAGAGTLREYINLSWGTPSAGVMDSVNDYSIEPIMFSFGGNVTPDKLVYYDSSGVIHALVDIYWVSGDITSQPRSYYSYRERVTLG
jgi:hypothetical protein